MLCLLVFFSLVVTKKALVIRKTESSSVKYNIKDFPEHGISLIGPTDAALGKTVAANPYSVLLKNTSNRMVVGYAIKWECTNGTTESVSRSLSFDRVVSNVASVVFMYGKEPHRGEIMTRMAQVIKPKSTWLISFDFPPQQIGIAGQQPHPEFDEAFFDPVREACPIMTVIADGIFFDDGTFIGSDTSNFFAETKAQIEARYELLLEVQNQLRSGKKADAVFSALERMHDSTQSLGDQPTISDLNAYFRSMYARDLVGKKNLWGTEKAIAEIEQNLSQPWVTLRKH